MPVLLCLVAVFLALGAFLRIASLIHYVSRSVITGYITAAAFLIIINQLKNVLGIELAESATFVDTLLQTFQRIGSVSVPSVMVGVFSLAVYIGMKRWVRVIPAVATTLLAATLLAVW